MHGSVGSSCAVADVQGDKATIYSPTQGVWYQKTTAAMILGLKPENVHVIFRRGSGCYGLNGADTVTYDAALLSQAVGKPVRVQLSRKDEMAWENYGNAWTIDERAGLDAKGNIIAWEHEAWTPGLGNRPGPRNSRQRRHRNADRFRARAFLARPRPTTPSATTTTATEFRPTSPATSASERAAPAPSRARRCWSTTCSRLSGPARCARPRACKIPSRMKASWTNWPRASKPIPSNSACAICTTSA